MPSFFIYNAVFQGLFRHWIRAIGQFPVNVSLGPTPPAIKSKRRPLLTNCHTKVLVVYGLLLLSKQFCHRYQTRTYIRLFSGDAISQPSMYAHPGAYLGRWTLWPQTRAGFTRADIFIWTRSVCLTRGVHIRTRHSA